MRTRISVILLAILVLFLPVSYAEDSWTCQNCGYENAGNYCSNCGKARPVSLEKDMVVTGEHVQSPGEQSITKLSKNEESTLSKQQMQAFVTGAFSYSIPEDWIHITEGIYSHSFYSEEEDYIDGGAIFLFCLNAEPFLDTNRINNIGTELESIAEYIVEGEDYSIEKCLINGLEAVILRYTDSETDYNNVALVYNNGSILYFDYIDNNPNTDMTWKTACSFFSSISVSDDVVSAVDTDEISLPMTNLPEMPTTSSSNGVVGCSKCYTNDSYENLIYIAGYGFVNEADYDGSKAMSWLVVTHTETKATLAYPLKIKQSVSGLTCPYAVCKNASASDFEVRFDVSGFEDGDYSLAMVIAYVKEGHDKPEYRFYLFDENSFFTVSDGKIIVPVTEKADIELSPTPLPTPIPARKIRATINPKSTTVPVITLRPTATPISRNKIEKGTILYDKAGIKVTLTGEKEIETYSYILPDEADLHLGVLVENNSNSKIRIYIEDASVNGWSINSYGLSGSIGKGKKRSDEFRIELGEANVRRLTQINELEFYIKIYNEEIHDSDMIGPITLVP